jgi:hypothetical protein
MNKKVLIYLVVGWVVLTIIEYYFVPYFIVTLLWVVLSFGLLMAAIIQIIKLIKERQSPTRLRVLKVVVFTALFYLTFNHSIINRLIEKVDWLLLYDRRTDIIEKVKQKELNPNVSWNSWICELPYELPVVSNGGNDIGIARNSDDDGLTVTFWVYRNFFSAPSTCFVYTTDLEQMQVLDELITHDPSNNWKIEDHWYRTFRE